MKSPYNNFMLVSVIYDQHLLAWSVEPSPDDSEATDSLLRAMVESDQTDLVTKSVNN